MRPKLQIVLLVPHHAVNLRYKPRSVNSALRVIVFSS
jgi:hypothetical protein